MEQPTAPLPLRRRLGPRWGAGIGYAAILILLFWRLLTGGVLNPAAFAGILVPFHTSRIDLRLNSNRIQGDVWTQFIPWQFEQYQHRGGVPMWNPYVYCGFPVFANGQSEFLNPTHWIYYFVNPDLVRGPMAILRLWVSAMAMFLLLRRCPSPSGRGWRVLTPGEGVANRQPRNWESALFGRGGEGAADRRSTNACYLSPLASFLGGAIWVLSAFNIRWLLWPHTDSSLVIPILLLALDYFLCRPTARRWALAALAGTLLALSGHPGTQVLVGIIAAIFVLVRLAEQRAQGVAWPTLGLRALGCAAAMVAALAGAAAAVLPLARQILGSYELTQTDRGSQMLSAKMLWLFLTPNIFGWPRGSHDFREAINYVEPCCWFGLVALALALAAAFVWCSDLFQIRNPKSEIRNSAPPRWFGGFAILLLAVSVPLAFGVLSYWPQFRASSFSRTTSFNRMFMGVHFAGAILAAMGIDQVLRTRPRRAAPLVFLLAFTLLACGYTLLGHPEQLQYFKTLFHEPWGGHELWGMIWLDSSFRVFGGLLLGAVACAVMATIFCSARRGKPVGAVLRYALAAVILADLLWVAMDYNPVSPLKLVQLPLPPEVRRIIDSVGDGRVVGSGSILSPNVATMYRFRDPRGYDQPKSWRLGNLLQILHLNPIYLTLVPHIRLAPVIDPALAAWLDRCSVRLLITVLTTPTLPIGLNPHPHAASQPSPPADRPWQLVQQTRDCSIYANPNAYPRAFMPVQAVRGSPSQALHALIDPGTDLRQKTVYESAPSAAMPPPRAKASGTVRITTDADEQVVLDVQTSTGGLVVLGDNMAEGWTATVDNAPAAPLTANYLFRAVQVPPGHHTIRWSYRTPMLLPGSIISIVTLIVLLYLVIRGPSASSPPFKGGRGWSRSAGTG